MAKTTTQNVRCTSEEKANWKQIAPSGNVSKWLRELANREVAKEIARLSS